MPDDDDRIVTQTLLRAPLERVWAAISDSRQFGAWFGAEFDGPFVAGQPLAGRIAPTTVDPEVAELQTPHAGRPMDIVVQEIAFLRRLTFRWRPYPLEAGEDPASAPMTLVAFELEPVEDGVRLTITESGFDAIPLDRRAAAFAANTGGWRHQIRLVARYVGLSG